jgi:hypothetical protein
MHQFCGGGAALELFAFLGKPTEMPTHKTAKSRDAFESQWWRWTQDTFFFSTVGLCWGTQASASRTGDYRKGEY